MTEAPFPGTWWVEDGQLLAGCYPGDRDNGKAAEKLQCLLDAGVCCFVSLQEPDEQSLSGPFNPYRPLAEDIAREKGIDVGFANFPVIDMSVPALPQMREILDYVQSKIDAGKCVYLHCWGGHGRTATVVGCWLREQGLSGEKALSRISELRQHDPYLAPRSSPQTPAQREMILHWTERPDAGKITRAQGCLLGQLAGDSLGSLVEFQTPDQIRRKYPDGVRELADGGTFNTLAGQPTDDSEMALLLARMLAERGAYDADAAREAYVFWLNSGPFDCGMTISSGLRGKKNPESQANGAMMRISPLGIFGSNHDLQRVAEWARQDANLTHPNPVCLQTNALYTMAVADAVRNGTAPRSLYEKVMMWANDMQAGRSVLETVAGAADTPPEDYVDKQGWVLIAFRNALWQLLYASTLEEAVVDTVVQGGDTDTNAAICGALLGAVHGKTAIPGQWLNCLLTCRPESGNPRVRHPRPECFWPVDAMALAEDLVSAYPGKDSTE
jgi:ADP-ribosyl-[dinitrogen reductase] hydrolase